MNIYKNCRLCGHECGVDRTRFLGRCHSGATPRVARCELHEWEEPPITGQKGSGTIFFSGCSLGCLFCQNRTISRSEFGSPADKNTLLRMMLSLEEKGATNINFVTPTHVIPTLVEAITEARKSGLSIPIVYNTSSYERVESLRMLDGLIDIYLPDLKYMDARLAKRYSGAENYPKVAKEAIAEMMRQCPTPIFSTETTHSPASEVACETPILLRGVVCRVLVLPNAIANACLSISHLYRTYGDNICISILGQYTPVGDLPPPLNRKITHEEYRRVVEYAEGIGVKNAFIQSLAVAEESFIPKFYENLSLSLDKEV